MNLEHVSQYLNDYVNMDNPQYAVMLKGKWGCGKTHYIKKMIESWNDEIKDSKDKISIRPIYVSLNGINTSTQVSSMIRRELRPFLYSKGIKVAKKVLFGTIKAASKGIIDLDNDGNKDDLSDIFDAESLFDILSKPNESVDSKKILIFDDLERCKIPTDEIFGYINNLVEHSDCKVIIIGEEDKIQKMYDESTCVINYKDFKEKLIGQTFAIRQNFDDIISQFIADSQNKYLTDNKELILELFIASKVENLRIIKQCFSDFNRLFKSINPSNYKEELFNDFIKNVVAYFVITYCEHKNGNKYIELFQNFSSPATDEEKKQVNLLENKYNNILSKPPLKHSGYSIEIKTVIFFIDNGFIPNLQSRLDSNEILNVRSMADWEIIWNYVYLDNTTFNSKLKSVKNLFYRGDIDCVHIVLDICAMFLTFNHIHLAKCNEQRVIKTAKRHINNIYKNANDKSKYKLAAGIHRRYGHSVYMKPDSPVMKDLISYAEGKLSNYCESERILFCKTFWENLTNRDSDNIYSILNETIPNGKSAYSLSAVFYGINTKKTALKFMQLSNESKHNLIYFLSGRYYLPESRIYGKIEDYHIKDLPSLEEIKSELEIKIKRTTQLDKLATQELIKTIGLCIDKLKNAKS